MASKTVHLPENTDQNDQPSALEHPLQRGASKAHNKLQQGAKKQMYATGTNDTIVCRRKSQNLLAPLSVIIKKMCRSFSKNSPYYSHFNNRSWAVAYICLLAPYRNLLCTFNAPLCRRCSNAEN